MTVHPASVEGPPANVGRSVSLGALGGFLGIGGLVLLGGWSGGMPLESAAGFGAFVGAWGGAGFGAMMGGVIAASRNGDGGASM